jgi:hypothetical protein
MIWAVANRASRRCRLIADRHYSRQNVGAEQFVRPGRCLVLYARTASGEALWVTSWQKHADHAWPGAWECTIFRNEGAGQSSALIAQAVSASRAFFGEPPAAGMITFVDPGAIRSDNPGYCFKRAGFRLVGATKVHRRPCLQLLPAGMPDAEAPHGMQFGGLAA